MNIVDSANATARDVDLDAESFEFLVDLQHVDDIARYTVEVFTHEFVEPFATFERQSTQSGQLVSALQVVTRLAAIDELMTIRQRRHTVEAGVGFASLDLTLDAALLLAF
jgi:hypothetical protein